MRTPIVIALAAAALATGAAPAAAASKGPLAAAKLTACVSGADAAARSLTAAASMRSRPGTARMDIRFDLQARPDARRAYRKVAAPGLYSWMKSVPRLSTFNALKTVQNLGAPAQYRLIVKFRWINAKGRAFAFASRITSVCTQPDPRPDLRITGFSGVRDPQTQGVAYAITLRNASPFAAGPFDLLLSVDGEGRPAVTVDGLGARETRVITVTAPRCTLGRGGVQVAVDPDGRVAERSEGNNTLRIACRRAQ